MGVRLPHPPFMLSHPRSLGHDDSEVHIWRKLLGEPTIPSTGWLQLSSRFGQSQLSVPGPPGRHCVVRASRSPHNPGREPKPGSLVIPCLSQSWGARLSASWVWVWGSRQRFPMPFFRGLNFLWCDVCDALSWDAVTGPHLP